MANMGWVDYFGVVASRKKQILAFTLACGLAAGIGFLFMPKTYESGVTIDVGIFSMLTKLENSNDEVLTEPIEPVLVVRDSITSKPFMAAVISRMNLDTTPNKLYKKVRARVNEDFRIEDDLVNRQVIISTKGDTPEAAKSLAETIAELVIEKHGKLYDQALVNRRAYEETLGEQVEDLGNDIDKLQHLLDRQYEDRNPDTVALVLLQSELYDKEKHITELKRELSMSQLLDNSDIKSTNTRITVPAYLSYEPSVSWYMNVLIGLIVGFLLSAAYFTVRESLGSPKPGE